MKRLAVLLIAVFALNSSWAQDEGSDEPSLAQEPASGEAAAAAHEDTKEFNEELEEAGKAAPGSARSGPTRPKALSEKAKSKTTKAKAKKAKPKTKPKVVKNKPAKKKPKADEE
jgi:hypothetical protein